VLAFPICSGISPSSFPVVLAALLYAAYPLWFVAWLIVLFVTLWKLGRLYGKTKMGMWWWLSVPYSVALPALSLVLGLKSWALAHVFGLFLLLAYLTVPSSVLWALATVVRMSMNRGGTDRNWPRLSAIPFGVLLWAAVMFS
jgi:hypothetical protein